MIMIIIIIIIIIMLFFAAGVTVAPDSKYFYLKTVRRGNVIF